VCGHVAQLPVAWAAARLRRGRRYYLVAHGIEVWRAFGACERFFLRGAERILCVSEHTRREFLRHAPVDPVRAVVLPNGLDPAFAIAPGKPLRACPPVIVAISRLGREDRYKGVDALVEAMPAVRASEPEARLRVIGQGEDRPRLESIARRLGLPDGVVEFLGPAGDARIEEELRECRLFALPSTMEGFGLVYLEAMAHGRPCLAARAAAAPELVTADTGILVEPGNPAALASGLVEGLRRTWDQTVMLDRAGRFSYELFKERLAVLLFS
ncbi:MAG: glycosyltransferase family 4 protein, partial [Opitutaceae bacterium]